MGILLMMFALQYNESVFVADPSMTVYVQLQTPDHFIKYLQ